MFRVYEFRDTDVMAKLAELGSISAHDLVGEMGGDGDSGRLISSRLSWMQRFGMVVHEPKGHTWRISEGGARVLESRNLAAAKRAVEKLPREQLVEVMAHITSIYRLGDPMLAAMLRREFQYGTNPRSAVWKR